MTPAAAAGTWLWLACHWPQWQAFPLHELCRAAMSVTKSTLNLSFDYSRRQAGLDTGWLPSMSYARHGSLVQALQQRMRTEIVSVILGCVYVYLYVLLMCGIFLLDFWNRDLAPSKWWDACYCPCVLLNLDICRHVCTVCILCHFKLAISLFLLYVYACMCTYVCIYVCI
jgi:hypothetical protein